MNKLFKFAATLAASSQFVPKKLTRMNGIDLAKALYEGYKAAFGSPPTLETLANGYSQAMHEQGGRFYNYNFGNITATKDYINSGGTYTLFTGIWENTETGGKTSINKNYFRAYDSPVAGAKDYWTFLKKRMPTSFAWMQTGNPVYTAFALRDERYYTGSSFAYARSMGSHMKKFLAEVGPQIMSLYPEIKSNPTPAPGPKPEVKEFRKTEVKEPDEKLAKLISEFPERNAPAKAAPTEATPNVDGLTQELWS